MTRFIAPLLAAVVLAGALPVAPPAAAQQRPTPETDPAGVLFWAPADRERAFRTMETILPHAPVPRGDTPVRALPAGAPIDVDPS
ncbi:MAG: hypothetical protein EON86_13350, partial [Brevundimonas sp.]